MEQESEIKDIIKDVEEYINTQKELGKLHLIEKVSVASSALGSNLVIFSFFLLMFLFLSFALAYYFSDLFGKTYIGFASVGLLYFIIGMVLFIKRESWLQKPITNGIIKNILNHE